MHHFSSETQNLPKKWQKGNKLTQTNNNKQTNKIHHTRLAFLLLMLLLSFFFRFIYIPFFSSGLPDVVGMWLTVVGFTVSLKLGRNSFHNVILSGRILDLTVKFALSPRYSPWSAVYWGQVVPNGVGLFGFLFGMMENIDWRR